LLIEGLIRSLDEANKEIDTIWAEEAEKRLKAHREGKTQDISYKEVLGPLSQASRLLDDRILNASQPVVALGRREERDTIVEEKRGASKLRTGLG
jgi:hypothetical protein